MGGDSIEPFGKETARATGELAKLGTRLLDSGDKLGSYLAGVAGPTPHNFVGVVVGDWLWHVRIRRWAKLQAETKRILQERNVHEPFEEISPSLAVPLIEAAIDESREELAQLWAKLLAAASDPARKNRVRLSFIATLKQMDPLDARILEALYANHPGGFPPNLIGRDVLAKQLDVSPDEVLVSFRNLERLECVDFNSPPKVTPFISASGRLLIGALRE
jgi:hypothetical protein